MLRVRYAVTMRPPDPGAIPRKGLLDTGHDEGVAPSGHHTWGWAEYDRRLTDEETDYFDMELISEEDI